MRAKWLLATGGALLLAGASYAAFSARSRHVVELALRSGVRVLRTPPRRVEAGPGVLLFGFDGVGRDAFDQAVRQGNLPSIAGLLGESRGDGRYAHGYAVPDALSILPSTTVAAWTSIFTGEPPGRTGVSGNEWFARDEVRFYAPAPVSLDGRLDTLRYLNEGLVGDATKVPTLFERAGVRAHVSLAHVYRGADIFTTPDPTAFADLAGAFTEGLTEPHREFERQLYSEVDEEAVDTLLKAIDDHGFPRLQVVYFPGVDLYTHVARDALAEQQRYLRDVIDPLLRRILERYRGAGLLDDTFVLFVADHGHTPVLHDDRHALATHGHDEAAMLLTALGYHVRPAKLALAREEEDFDAVVAYQGAIAYVYLADRSTCPGPGRRCDWSRPPRFIEDVLPVARAFHRASAAGEGMPALEGAIDLVLAREGWATGEDTPPFQVFDGERLVGVREHLARHPRPDLLRFAERIEALGRGPYGHRAGDVLLLARSGLDRPIQDRFYFARRYRSWHGSPSAQDSRIPLVLARRGADGGALEAIVRASQSGAPSQLDVTPLVLRLLRAQGE